MESLSLLVGMAQQQGGGDPQAPAGCAGGGMQGLIMMALMIGVFYFLIIRPQSKKAKEHARMLDALKKGDEVVTRGGVIGKVSGIAGNIVTLELQEKVRVRVLKSFIDGRFGDGAAAKAEGKTETAAEKN